MKVDWSVKENGLLRVSIGFHVNSIVRYIYIEIV